MTIFRPGWRSSAPDSARRSVWIAVSMQVDRQVLLLRLRQDGFEPWIVQESAVGGAVHQHAVEAELGRGAVQFLGRGFGFEQGKMSEAAKAGGMVGAGLGEGVVVGSGEIDAGLAGDQVGARAGDRQHLGGDPAGVHVGQTGVAEVGEFGALDGLRPEEVRVGGEAAPGDRVGGDAGDDARHGEVFFQGDDTHAGTSPLSCAEGDMAAARAPRVVCCRCGGKFRIGGNQRRLVRVWTQDASPAFAARRPTDQCHQQRRPRYAAYWCGSIRARSCRAFRRWPATECPDAQP